MYICVCKAVSDRKIRQAVGEGAVTLRDLTREFALGTCCGKCVPAAREVLESALASAHPMTPMLLSQLSSESAKISA